LTASHRPPDPPPHVPGTRSSSASKAALRGSSGGENARDAPLPVAAHPSGSGGSSLRSGNSYGSFAGDDEELRGIIVRTIHGMKVRR